MKILHEEKPWEIQKKCKCGALLLVEEEDVFAKVACIDQHDNKVYTYYFECPCCDTRKEIFPSELTTEVCLKALKRCKV